MGLPFVSVMQRAAGLDAGGIRKTLGLRRVIKYLL